MTSNIDFEKLFEETLDEIAEEERAELFEPLPPTTNFPNQQIFEYEIPVETERLFEQVMRESQIRALFEEFLREMTINNYKCFGIFSNKIFSNTALLARYINVDFLQTIVEYNNNKYYDCVILPCTKNKRTLTTDPIQLHKQMTELIYEKKKAYSTDLNYLITYEKVLDTQGVLQLSEKLLGDVINQKITAQSAIKQRTNADPKNQ